MARIPFPICYDVKARYGHNRKDHTLNVTETVEFDIPEFSSADAQVVAEIDARWRIDLAGIQPTRARADNEAFAIRTIGDDFLVPVRMYSKHFLTQWEPVTSAHFPDLHTPKRFAISPFKLASRHYAERPTHVEVGHRDVMTHIGNFSDWEELRVKSVSNDQSNRDHAVQSVNESLQNFVFIDNELWQRTSHEPAIRYRKGPYRDSVVLDVTIADHSDLADGGYFRLDRLDDCREFLSEAYPGVAVSTHIKSIAVHQPDVLSLDGDFIAMDDIAGATRIQLSHKEGFLADDNRMRGHYFDLQAAASGYEGIDQKAEITARIAQDAGREYGLDLNLLNAVVKRWELRPIEKSLSFGR